MYKLNGHSLTRGVWFIPESQAMTVQERNSVSSITLNPDAPGIDFNDWLLDCEWPEGTYVWRVRDLGDTPTNDTRNIELEHVIRVLDDTSMFGEITTEMISGGDTATAEETVRYILAHQSDWVLGDFDFNVSNAYTFNGDSLLDALESVMGTLDNPVWEYDMGQYPFVLHIRERSNVVGSEMRGCRNLSTLRRSVSRNGFYTRFYPIGKNDLHITGDYLSKNENLYGRVDKVETDQTKDTEGALEAWAQGKLNRHCEPRVTITVTGLELSAETGEDLDRLKLNRYCSVPLPEFGTTICERITRLQFRDRIKEPENVTVTLCNNLLDISEIIREEQRAGSAATGRAGRAQAKQNYMFEANGEHLLYEVFDECGHLHGILRMTSESLRIAFDNAIECTRGEFLMTSESLRISFMNEIECTRSQFELTSESLRVSFMNEIECTRSSFEMTSESLRVEFLSEISSARSDFEMTSESLRLEFQAADSSIRSLIEVTSESLQVAFNNEIDSARSDFEITSESLRVEFQTADSSIRSLIEVTSESLRVAFNNEIDSARSDFEITSESLRVEFQAADSSIRSLVEQTASAWSVSIAGVADESGRVTAASIAAKINEQGSTVRINADRIFVDSTNQIKLDDVLTIVDGAAIFHRTVQFNSTGGVVSINGGKVSANTLQGGQLTLTQTNPEGGSTTQSIGVNTLKSLISGVSVANNVLTLTKVDGTSVNFSKATTLSQDNWSSGHLRVLAKQTNYDETTQTNKETQVGNYDVYLIDSSTKENLDGTAYTTWNDEWYVPVHAKTSPYSQTSEATGLRVHVDASSIRTAGKNEVGISDLAWEHDGDYFSNHHNSTNKISNNTTGRPTQITKDASINMTQDANWASDNTKWVYVRQGTSSTGQYVAGLEVNASSVRTAGKNDVGLSDLAWEHDGDYFSNNHNSTNKISNNTTGRPTQITKDASINMTQDANWASDNTKWVYVRQGTSSTGQYVAGLEVNASSVRTAGKNDVGLSDLAWEHDGSYFSTYHNSTNKISNNTTGRPTQITKDAYINMTQDANWDSNDTKWVYVRQGTSSSGQCIAGLQVTAPTPKKLANTTNSPQLTYNGFHFPPSGYDGWSEVEVNIQMEEKEFTANTSGWVYPSSGYGGFERVKVNVPSGGGGGGNVTVTAEVAEVPENENHGYIYFKALKNGTVADTETVYLEVNSGYFWATLDNYYSASPNPRVCGRLPVPSASHSISCSTQASYGANPTGLYCGYVSKSVASNRNYIVFAVKCGSKTQNCYITLL